MLSDQVQGPQGGRGGVGAGQRLAKGKKAPKQGDEVVQTEGQLLRSGQGS